MRYSLILRYALGRRQEKVVDCIFGTPVKSIDGRKEMSNFCIVAYEQNIVGLLLFRSGLKDFKNCNILLLKKEEVRSDRITYPWQNKRLGF